MDKHGYPDENDLKEVRILSGSFKEEGSNLNVFQLIETLQELWRWENYIDFHKTDKEWSLQISTGGWSGHETVMSELEGSLFWFMHWQKSLRGGHFWFHGKINKAAKGGTNK
jgi:hypothetical protein